MDTYFEATKSCAAQTLLKKWLDNILYLPEMSLKDTSTPAKSVSDIYSRQYESAICSNLREIQQEEEIIFFEPVKKFDARPVDVTFNGAGSK